jgi:flagellar basal body-associated protein FliL
MDEKEKKSAPGGAEAAYAEGPKPSKKINTGKILLYAIIAGALVLNTIVAVVLINVTKPKDPAEKEAEALKTAHGEGEGGAPAVHEGEPIEDPVEAIVNIAGTGGDRFLKVVLLLCYDPQKYPKLLGGGGGEGGKALGAKKAVLKDILIEILSQMTLVELGEPETREKIRMNFLRKANNTLPPGVGEYSNVLIDQFIIQ